MDLVQDDEAAHLAQREHGLRQARDHPRILEIEAGRWPTDSRGVLASACAGGS